MLSFDLANFVESESFEKVFLKGFLVFGQEMSVHMPTLGKEFRSLIESGILWVE